jgi:hypothetical protein
MVDGVAKVDHVPVLPVMPTAQAHGIYGRETYNSRLFAVEQWRNCVYHSSQCLIGRLGAAHDSFAFGDK